MSKTNPGGTILNNESLEQDERRELTNNDIIQVCGRRFLFTRGAPAPFLLLGVRAPASGSASRAESAVPPLLTQVLRSRRAGARADGCDAAPRPAGGRADHEAQGGLSCFGSL